MLFIPYDRKFWWKENLMNSQFSSIDEINVDECLDFSKSYTWSIKVWQIEYWCYQNLSNSSNFSFVKISCRTVAAVTYKNFWRGHWPPWPPKSAPDNQQNTWTHDLHRIVRFQWICGNRNCKCHKVAQRNVKLAWITVSNCCQCSYALFTI